MNKFLKKYRLHSFNSIFPVIKCKSNVHGMLRMKNEGDKGQQILKVNVSNLSTM